MMMIMIIPNGYYEDHQNLDITPYIYIYINIRFRIIHQGSCIHVGKDSTYNKVNIVGPDNNKPKLYSTNRAVSKYYLTNLTRYFTF